MPFQQLAILSRTVQHLWTWPLHLQIRVWERFFRARQELKRVLSGQPHWRGFG